MKTSDAGIISHRNPGSRLTDQSVSLKNENHDDESINRPFVRDDLMSMPALTAVSRGTKNFYSIFPILFIVLRNAGAIATAHAITPHASSTTQLPKRPPQTRTRIRSPSFLLSFRTCSLTHSSPGAVTISLTAKSIPYFYRHHLGNHIPKEGNRSLVVCLGMVDGWLGWARVVDGKGEIRVGLRRVA